MGNNCFLCDEPINEESEILALSTRYGDLVSIAHEDCYNFDYRKPLDINKIQNLSKRLNNKQTIQAERGDLKE